MIRILHGLDLAPWVLKRIPVMHRFGPNVCIGVGDDERLLAAAVYYQYDGYNMQMAFATDSPKAITRMVLRELLGYPFHIAGCGRVTNFVEATNVRSIRLTEGVGFKREGLIRRGYRNGNDAIVYGLLPEDAERWIGKVRTDHAAAA